MKRKNVILEDDVHTQIKHFAIDLQSTIQEQVNKILRKELNIEIED